VGNLDLEVAEERHVQELEPPLEEEERQRLELEQRLARKEEEARLERERIAREEEEERVKQQKLKEYYDKYNADVLARVERQKREEERQKQLQKFKEYQEQQVREVLIQLEHKKQLEKLRLTEVLDKLKEGVVSLELANKQATKLLPGGFFFKEHLLVREAKKQLGLQKVALENGVIPGLEKLEELEELVIGITRTAEVITQETQRLRQVEAVKARIKLEQIKEPLIVEKSLLQKIKEKLGCCFSANDHELKPKMIEMVSMHTNVQDEEISVNSIGEQVTVNSSVEIV
jgi:IgA-specific serine endopeptidase